MKSGNFNFLEPSGPPQAYNGTALPFTRVCLHERSNYILQKSNYKLSVRDHSRIRSVRTAVMLSSYISKPYSTKFDYGLDGPGIESRCGRNFPHVSRPALGAHPASCTMGTGSFPGVKCGRGVLLTIHPLLVLRSCKSRAIPLPTLWATPGL
jgi:hypothetical protein